MARGLDWTEVYFYQQGYAARRQHELAGHRLTATLLRNSMSEKPMSPAEFLPLPLVDGDAPAVTNRITSATTAALQARMRERFGSAGPPTPAPAANG